MNPRKRAWFQLHLSTCIVLMVAAGALMWANVTHTTYGYDGVTRSRGFWFTGWPMGMMVRKEVRFVAQDRDRPIEDREAVALGPPEIGTLPDGQFLIRPAIANLCVALALLIGVTFA